MIDIPIWIYSHRMPYKAYTEPLIIKGIKTRIKSNKGRKGHIKGLYTDMGIVKTDKGKIV